MKKDNLFEKGAQKAPPPPYSSPLLSVLHQKKALDTFHKRGQRSIVERNIDLEYALTTALYMLNP